MAEFRGLPQRSPEPITDCARREIGDDLARHAGLGGKASGHEGELGIAAWQEERLRACGFAIERQGFDVPGFLPDRAELSLEGLTAKILPQAIVTPTGTEGISGPLAVRPLDTCTRDVAQSIVLLQLPHARWSSAASGPVRDALVRIFDAGARGIVLVTNGLTRGPIALNADPDDVALPGPVGVLGPAGAKPFLARDGEEARLTLHGLVEQRSTYNLIGRLDRGHCDWLVISTPRSGWFGCVGERGPGTAVWMVLAKWLASSELGGLDLPCNILFVSTSGHEYENLGARRLCEAALPSPEATRLWLHLGANVATRAWHEHPSGLRPLSGTDAQRFLVTCPSLVEQARAAFEGEIGLEDPYAATGAQPGEFGAFRAAGYMRSAGIFGAHPFHHSPDDDLRCVDADLVLRAAEACQRFITAVIAS